MKGKRLLMVLLLAVASLPVSGSDEEFRRLDGSKITPSFVDETVQHLMTAAEVTGVGIAVFDQGRVVFLKAYGVRDKEKNLLLTPDSVTTAASFSKSAFAYMVMQLVDEKILDLDRPVYKYLPKPLPEYPAYQDLAVTCVTSASRHACSLTTRAAFPTCASSPTITS